MLTYLLVRAVQPKLRPFAFAVGSLECLPFIYFLWLMVRDAENAAQARNTGLILAGVLLVSLTHATIFWSVTANRRGLLWVADVLLILGNVIGLSGVVLSIVTPPPEGSATLGSP